MKKATCLLSLIFFLAACHSPGGHEHDLQSQIDTLQKRLDAMYKPGLGEFMLGLQIHHAKLWFAGKEQNWPLANFEIQEIRELVGNINIFCQDRPEIKQLPVIAPPLDSIAKAIQQLNLAAFTKSFTILTGACNSCHEGTAHGFNVITIPTSLPVTNQDFKPIPR